MIIGPAFTFRKEFLCAKKKKIENEFSPADSNSERSEN